MSFQLIDNAYGKSAVRLTKVVREGVRHTLQEYDVAIQLRGSFEQCYTAGDNSMVLPTDTMKNTVYALAAQHAFESPEAFAVLLADHFLKHEQVPHCTSAKIDIIAELWNRVDPDHDHAFVSGGGEKRLAGVNRVADSTTITGGIENLVVAKTTNSEFHTFIRDRYTTLPDTNDRIFGTSIKAVWTFDKTEADFNAIYKTARSAIIRTFAKHHSLSVQQTLQAMGEAVLLDCSPITQIEFWLPNQHRIPFNLQPFGLENKNEIFVTTSEPFGYIGGTIKRA